MSGAAALQQSFFEEPRPEPAPRLALVRGGDPERPTTAEAREVLERYWGYPSFRPGQEEVIASVLEGRDVLAVLPTGAGKSAIYQTSALLLPGLTVVISPLISLMQDQIEGLERREVPAAFINSSLTPRQAEERMRRAEAGELKLLYVAPERFESPVFREWIRRVEVSLYAIDEAHCLSEWGHDFRPAYLRLGAQRALLGDPPILAVTATATAQVRDDIVRHLGLNDPAVHVGGFDRPNLAWRVVRAADDDEKSQLLREELRGLRGSAVVYASTQKAVDTVAEMLNDHGFPAVPYHAGKGTAERRELQERFMGGEVPIVVATTAFGMGVDKDDVRKVVHYNFPGTIEAYYQEAGRAGRDGGPAECVVLYSSRDASTHEFLLSLSHPSRPWYIAVYRALLDHADERGRLTISQAELARRMEWPVANPVSHCLRVLHDAGIVHHTTRKSAGVFVVLRKATEEIREILAPEARGDERHVLREIWRMGGGRRLYRGVMIRARDLATIQGEMKAVRKALRWLEAEGVLAWKEEAAGTRILQRDLDPGRLPLPWSDLERRREQEFGKLRRVMEYAETPGCRRGDLLRYFGDPGAMAHCGRCDNCA